MNCKKCGNLLSEGATSCPFCGEPVVNETSQVIDSTVSASNLAASPVDTTVVTSASIADVPAQGEPVVSNTEIASPVSPEEPTSVVQTEPVQVEESTISPVEPVAAANQATLDTTTPVSASTSSLDTTAPKKKSVTSLIIIIVALILIAGMAVSYFLFLKDDTSSANVTTTTTSSSSTTELAEIDDEEDLTSTESEVESEVESEDETQDESQDETDDLILDTDYVDYTEETTIAVSYDALQ